MHNHALSHLSRRMLAALFLMSAAAAAWAGCCDGGDPGRMMGDRSMACMCATADATTRDAPFDTHYDTAFTIQTPDANLLPRDKP